MRQQSITRRCFLILPLLVSLLSLAACQATTAQPAKETQLAAAAARATTALPPPPSATVAATTIAATTAPTQAATPTAEPTRLPSSTPIPATATPEPALAVAQDGLSGWCVPPESLLLATADPASPPEGAKIGKLNGDAFEVNNLPSNGCVFVYTFNQPAPDGLKLAVYELNQKTPWLQADLKPVNGKPNSAAAILRHSYIIAPPVWKISYTFAVIDASGKELRRDRVNLNRWTPRTCWNGQPPNVNTLRCPLAEDLHPWDPSYLTPIPTYLPPDYWKGF